jgi:hypothetical protein
VVIVLVPQKIPQSTRPIVFRSAASHYGYATSSDDSNVSQVDGVHRLRPFHSAHGRGPSPPLGRLVFRHWTH